MANKNRSHLSHISETLDFAKDYMKSSYEIAVRENSFIYHAAAVADVTLPTGASGYCSGLP